MAEAANADGDYVQMDAVDWVPFPQGLCQGPIKWKLLHVSPEAGRGRRSSTVLQVLRSPSTYTWAPASTS